MSDYVISPEKFCLNPNVEYIGIEGITYARYKSTASTRICNMKVLMNMLVIILEGSKYAYIEPGENMIVRKNEAFFLPKGAHLVTEVVSEFNQFKSLVFFIDDAFMKKFIAKYVKIDGIIGNSSYSSKIFKIETNSFHFDALQKVIPFFVERKDLRNELFKLKLEELLLIMMSTEEGAEYFADQKRMLKTGVIDLCDFMELNYRKPYTIERFASESGRSLSAFKREFKKVYNSTPKKWLNDKRLILAALLIENTDLNITDICYETGFENLSYFIKLFKERFSHTPKHMQMNLVQQ